MEMIIDRRRHRKVGSGVYADVFAVGDCACKLFRSGPEVPPRQTKEGRRRVFESQCEAFQLSSADSWLRNHVAHFYGTTSVDDVLNMDGLSIRRDYLLDCCYGIELFGFDDSELKATAEGVKEQHYIQEAVRRFTKLAIATHDSSVFRFHDPLQFKFIDIEMQRRF